MIRDTAKEVDGGIIIWGWGTLGSCLGRGAQVKGLLVKEGFSVHRLGTDEEGVPQASPLFAQEDYPGVVDGINVED